jgi:hypothetical protein
MNITYAINKETKEHRRTTEADRFDPSLWRIVRAPEGWIPWDGNSECPLPRDTLLKVGCRDGVINKRPAEDFRWDHCLVSEPDDIVAYRPVLSAKPSCMKPDDWIAASEIDSEDTLEAIRDAIRNAEYRVRDSFGRWSHRVVDYVLLLDEEGDLIWANKTTTSHGDQVHVTDILNRPQGHPHAELMAQYAEDAAKHPEPWTLWEMSTSKTNWIETTFHPRWQVDTHYRRKPEVTVSEFGDTWRVHRDGERLALLYFEPSPELVELITKEHDQ